MIPFAHHAVRPSTPMPIPQWQPAGNQTSIAEQAPARFLIEGQWPVPLASDGLPLWAPPERVARASLRPQKGSVLSIYRRIGYLSVGRALREFGRALWEVKLGKARRRGMARKILADALRSLGGRRSAEGQEFERRARRIGRFLKEMVIFRNYATRHFIAAESRIVWNEVEYFRLGSMHTLANGGYADDPWSAGLMRTIECRIAREVNYCFTWPFHWIWWKVRSVFRC